MYHVELRRFPYNVCRFNLDEGGLRAIVEPWARGQVVELGGRGWSPHTAKLTLLEGPEIPPAQLTMGRGWRVAQRQGSDVTERVLGQARAAARAPGVGGPAPGTPGTAPMPAPAPAAHPGADPGGTDAFTLGAQIATLLGPEPLRLLEAWRATAAREPGLSPSEALAMAERALRNEPPGASGG